MSFDSDAYDLSRHVAPDLTEAEREYSLLVARHESFYGKAQTPAVWIGTHNWGAIQGVGPAGSFSTQDSHEDGATYQGQFKRYNTDEEGYADLVRVLLKTNVRAALVKGDATAALLAQRANRYYEAKAEAYRTALLRNYEAWQLGMGRVGVLSFPPLVPAPTGGTTSESPPLSPSDITPFAIRRAADLHGLPVMWVGSYGRAVMLACLLLGIKPSFSYDSRVRTAVLEFQTARKLAGVDGIIGDETWSALFSECMRKAQS